MIDLLDYSVSELEVKMKEFGQPKFRAKQLLQGYYCKLSLQDLSNIPKSFIDTFSCELLPSPSILQIKESAVDDTKKILYLLHDGNIVEGVLMSYNHGNTLCVSTQVGCRMGCDFCASTKQGLVRNLSSGEILAQVLLVNKHFGDGKNRFVSNIVLMGSGEPLDNFDNTVKFLNNAISQEGFLNISSRNISLSTCGLCDKIDLLADMNFGITLSISLHSIFQIDREKIMPIAKRYSVDETISSAKRYFSKTGRRIIFEYAVCDKFNMSSEVATAMSEKLRGFPCHVNVILLNPILECSLAAPSKKQAYNFVEQLSALGISATLRRQMGVDIDGACGQLRQTFLNNIRK